MLTNQNFVKVFFLETHVERISNLQDIKKAELDRETGLFLYKDMTLGRRFEDKCAEMYYRGKMFGFVHLYNGQEAISTGVIGAMKKKHDCHLLSDRLVKYIDPDVNSRPQKLQKSKFVNRYSIIL